jgi:hypothetical protein
MTDDVKKLIGYYEPEFNIDDEVIFITKRSSIYDNLNLYGKEGIITRQIPVLADDEHFWFWDYDIKWHMNGELKNCSPWHIEPTERQKRDKQINNITNDAEK